LYFIMCLTFAILCVFYVYFMCAAIGVIINDDDYSSHHVCLSVGSRAASYKRPLLSDTVSVSDSVCDALELTEAKLVCLSVRQSIPVRPFTLTPLFHVRPTVRIGSRTITRPLASLLLVVPIHSKMCYVFKRFFMFYRFFLKFRCTTMRPKL